MKKMLFVTLFSLSSFFAVGAQTSENVSQLTPVSATVGRFTGRTPNKNLKFDAQIEFVNLPNGKKGIAVTMQTPYRELVFVDKGGVLTAETNIYGRIISEDKKIDGFFDERFDVETEAKLLADKNFKGLAKLRKVFELPEGKYQIGVIVKDRNSGWQNVKVVKFQIDSGKIIIE